MTIFKYFMILLMGMIIYSNSSLAADINNINNMNERSIKQDPCQIMLLFSERENDPCWIVREQTFRQEVHFAKTQTEPWIKQEVVYRLLSIAPKVGLSGQACTWLLTFGEKDFDDRAKNIIRKAMEKPGKGTVLICGVANIQEELPNLKKLLVDELEYQKRTGESWRYELSWKARLARARMGVKEDINRCIELAGMELDRKLMTLSLFRDIGYIRQPEAIDFLMTYIFSDERLEQLKPTDPGEPVASYVIDILAGCLRDFPVKSGGRRYKPEEIELCRKWMSEQKEWKIIR